MQPDRGSPAESMQAERGVGAGAGGPSEIQINPTLRSRNRRGRDRRIFARESRECVYGFTVDDGTFISFRGMNIIIARDEFGISVPEKIDAQEAPEARG